MQAKLDQLEREKSELQEQIDKLKKTLLEETSKVESVNAIKKLYDRWVVPYLLKKNINYSFNPDMVKILEYRDVENNTFHRKHYDYFDKEADIHITYFERLTWKFDDLDTFYDHYVSVQGYILCDKKCI